MENEKPITDDDVGILQEIETIVYLMFENRSLDNVLGWLYEGEQPRNMVPPIPHGPQYDGLRQNTYSLPLKAHIWSDVKYYPIQKGVGSNTFNVPNLDPNEAYPNVINQLFGDATNWVETPPPPQTPAPMQGFLQDFDANDDTWYETLQITKTYTPADLPVLNGLAKQYAVSDRWYCSMPTQTNPNRAFSLCGTSLGRLENMHWSAIEKFETPTIWNALATKNTSMGIYYHKTWQGEQCFTQYTFPNMDSIDSSLLHIEKIDHPTKGFYALAKSGNLPAFTYIEPKWGYGVGQHTMVQGNDYHPPTDVRYGEKLLYDVYTALKSNPDAWAKTLLIVTFDEHGGTYDHHSPAWGAINPGDPQSSKSPFKFDLYGVRVPTLLISPLIPQGTVFRQPFNSPHPYDHTSILASLLKWKGIDPAKSGLLNRVACAPSFESVVTNKIVNNGVDLPDPGPQFRIDSEIESDGGIDSDSRVDGDSRVNSIDEYSGVPGSVVRYISYAAATISEAQMLLKDYKASVKK